MTREHELLERLIRQGEQIMAAIDDLNTAVTDLQTAATNIVAALGSSDNDAAIETAVGNINSVAASLNAAVTPPSAPSLP